MFLLVFAKTSEPNSDIFFLKKNLKFLKSKFFRGPLALNENWNKFKNHFLKITQILKSLWSKGFTHKIWAIGDKNFFCFKGESFGVFAIFEVSLYTHWLTLTHKNGESDFLDYWTSGLKWCLNIKKVIWEQVLGLGMTFHWVTWLKTQYNSRAYVE